MEISTITAIIMSVAPAVTAVIGIIVALGVGIGNIKRANNDVVSESKQTHRDVIDNIVKQNADLSEKVSQIAQNNANLMQENAELKRDLRKIMAKLNNVHLKE